MLYRIKDIQERVKQGDEKLLRNLYQEYKPVFVKWLCWHFSCDEDDAKDAFQKSFAGFYFNILNDKINNTEIKLETYLLGIGKNVIRKMKQQKPLSVALEDAIEEVKDDFDYFEKENQYHNQKAIDQILEKIGEPCKTILYQYYFLNFSMEAIAIRQGYKNETVAKKKKFLCIQKIRELLKAAVKN
ncbi:MAG: RNA polymerase sigma factor [Cyclobacteriaceae bacterium]